MMLSLTVLLLVAVTGVFSASTVPKCTPEIINKVQEQWEQTGVPHKVTSLKDSFKILAGSLSPIAKQGYCKTFKFTPGHLVDESDNISLPCSEKNGVLSLPDSDSYVYTYDGYVITTVRCSKDGPAPTKDNDIVLSLGATSKATPDDIKKHYGFLAKIGQISQYHC